MKLRLLGPAALICASSACFATRNDVRILQEDIFSLRNMQARADSARARQLTDISTALSTQNANTLALRDSVRDVGMRLTAFQGATRQELYSLGERLIQLGELMGASAQAMRNFRASLEEQNRQTMEQAVRNATPAPVAGDTTTRTSVPPPRLTEGPNVMFQIARDQLSARAWSSAREAFNKLINDHPTSDLVPDSYLGIADAYDAEGNAAQGDSVYRLIVRTFPTVDAAPRALYKLGLSLDRQSKVGAAADRSKKKAEARTTMQEVVTKYPRSDEATLATDWLRNNPA